MKILVYSSEETARENVKSILGDHYDMILTDSVEQCQECIKNTDIGTLIYDTDKQDKALEDIKTFRSNNPKLKIIALVGYNGEKTAKEAVNAGADTWTGRPIKSDELLSVCK